MEERRITIFAETTYRQKNQRFGIYESDRLFHIAIVGKTGTGKSTLLRTLMVSDAVNHAGFSLIDPHGDLAEQVVSDLPAKRRSELVYFNPARKEGRLAFNVLASTPDNRHLVVSGVIGTFQKIFPQHWGHRMEHILRHALTALTMTEDATLADVPRLLVDDMFRERIVGRLSRGPTRDFWQMEFSRYTQSARNEATGPILNKVGQLLAHPAIEQCISRPRSAFDLRRLMDYGGIFIANLSKGKLGEDASALLGSLLTVQFELAALSRADLSPEERRNHYLYIDEFPTVAASQFKSVLSESRKYSLGVTMAMQYVEQTEPELRRAVFENAGTIISFRTGPESARYLAHIFEPVFEAIDIIDLPRYHIYLRLMIDGTASKPFSARTIGPTRDQEKRRRAASDS
jgi:type IV secretory pathway TraG/TraD family ATPase VirD4